MSLDPNKTYLTWNGSEFPNSSEAKFKAPAGSSIDWGDGTVETFETASETVNTHTYTDGKDTHTIAISGLTSIGSSAFSNCRSLTSIEIPDSVTSIGEYAFRDCKSLTSVIIPNSVTTIGGSAFYRCSRLTSIVISDSVTIIGSSAFRNCTSLKQLILFPSTPPTLGSSAIPGSVQSIYVTQSSKSAYQAATNWNYLADRIVSDNLYMSFIRFNQKNKKYIAQMLETQKADLTKEVAEGYVAKLTSKYRVIRDITLEEDTQEVYITTDKNGNTFKLKSVFVMYYGKFTGVNAPGLYLRFNEGAIYQMYYYMKNTSISTEKYYRHWIKSDRYGSSNSGETIWQSIYANKLLYGKGQGTDQENADLASDLSFAKERNSVTEIGYACTTNDPIFATGGRIIFWGIDDDE